jgi:Polysaccharide lyase
MYRTIWIIALVAVVAAALAAAAGAAAPQLGPTETVAGKEGFQYLCGDRVACQCPGFRAHSRSGPARRVDVADAVPVGPLPAAVQPPAAPAPPAPGPTAPTPPVASEPKAPSPGSGSPPGPPKCPPGPTPPKPDEPIWSADFETGDLSQGAMNQSCPDGVAVVNELARQGHYAARFTVSDQSTRARCPAVPNGDPRAQLISPELFREGDDRYIGFSTFFPADFPTISKGWMQVAEIYGPPFAGAPSIGIFVEGDRLVLSRDQAHHWDDVWESTTPIAKGTQWEDIVLHVKFSTDPTIGFVELWHDGVQQKFVDGSSRIYYATLVPGITWNGSPNRFILNQYRSSSPELGPVTLYHDAAKVGKSYASVAP